MINNRIKELETIRTGFILPSGEPDAAVLYSVTGLYGTGKSVFVQDLTSELITKDVTDALMIVKDFSKFNFLTDIASVLTYSLINRHTPNTPLNSSETNYNLNKFYELLNEMKVKEYSLFEKYTSHFALCDYYSRACSLQGTTNELNEIERLVAALYAKKGDRRLLLEMPAVVVESLIVDLMSNFFPLNNTAPDYNYYISLNRKCKIIIIFDNIDPVDYSIARWLSQYLLPYAFEKHFNDFISFKIANISPEVKISDFFDFRFVISSRRKLSEYSLPELNYLYSLNRSIEFKPMEPDELTDYLVSNDIVPSISPDQVYNRTKGLQSLLFPFLKDPSLSSNTQNNLDYFSPVLSQLFDGRSEDQINWIVWTSYLDRFSINSLSLFPDISPNEEEVFKYLYSCFESVKFGNDISIIPEIRYVIFDYITITQPQNESAFQHISNVHRSVKQFLDRFDSSELLIMRNLAYFEKFDTIMIAEPPFNCDSNYVRRLIDNNPDLFNHNTFSVSLQPSVRESLMLYNNIIDSDSEDKQNKASLLWDNYYSDIGTKILGIEQEILELKITIDILDKDIKEARVINLADQSEFFDTENKINDLNKQSLQFSLKKNLKPVILNFSFGILGSVATFFSQEILSGTVLADEPWPMVSFYSLLSISCLLIITGFVWLLRTTVYRDKIKGMKLILNQLSLLNKEKKSAATKMENSSNILHEIESKISSCENIITEKQAEIERLRNRLVEN